MQEVAMVACGSTHTAAITPKGDLYMWGGNEQGQLGLVLSQSGTPKQVPLKTKIKYVACGWAHTTAIPVASGEGCITWGWGKLSGHLSP